MSIQKGTIVDFDSSIGNGPQGVYPFRIFGTGTVIDIQSTGCDCELCIQYIIQSQGKLHSFNKTRLVVNKTHNRNTIINSIIEHN